MSSNRTLNIMMGIFGVVGLVFLIVSGLTIVHHNKVLTTWDSTPAVITDMEHTRDFDGDSHTTVYVDYEYKGQSFREMELGYYVSTMHIGDELTIYIDPVKGTIAGKNEFLIMGGVFGVIGLVFFLISLIMFIRQILSKHKYEDLMTNGMTIYAEIVSMNMDYRFAVNDRHPWVIICKYTDEITGEFHEFHSQHIWENPTARYNVGDTIRVKVRPGNYKDYVVDLTGLEDR